MIVKSPLHRFQYSSFHDGSHPNPLPLSSNGTCTALGFISQRTTTLARAAYPSDGGPSCPVHHPRSASSSAAPTLEARVASLFSPSPLPFLPFAWIPGIHQSQICRLEGNSTVPSTFTVKVKWVSQIFSPGSQKTIASGCDTFAPALAYLLGPALPGSCLARFRSLWGSRVLEEIVQIAYFSDEALGRIGPFVGNMQGLPCDTRSGP